MRKTLLNACGITLRAAVMAAAAGVPNVASAADGHLFEAYAVPVYMGPSAPPDFKHAPKFRMLRTVIREGASRGVNFAGHYAVVQTGCGTDCMVVTLVDVRSGKIFGFPLGGETYYNLSLDFHPNSKLLKARWQDMSGNNPACVRQDYVLAGTTFKTLGKNEDRQPGPCPY